MKLIKRLLSNYVYGLPIAICLLFISGSCNKETEEVALQKFPIRLSFDQLDPISEMRFFAGGVELNVANNQQNLLNFLERKYYTNTATGTIHHQSTFIEPNADSYRNSSFVYDNNNKVSYVVDIIETKRQDGLTIMKSRVTNKVADVPIVKSDLFKYKFDIHSNGTYNYQYVVTEGNQSADVSLLYYKLVRYNEQGERRELAFGTVHNQFNESFINSLQARDTLAIKEYRLKYTAKD